MDLHFGDALHILKKGRKVARRGWNGQGMFVEMQRPDTHSKMRRPYLYMSPVGGDLVPWVASQSDLLAEDWYEVTDEPAEAEATPEPATVKKPTKRSR